MIIGQRLANLYVLYAVQNTEILLPIKELMEGETIKFIQSLKRGKVEINKNITPQLRLKYTKTLQDYRVQKLKLILHSQRKDLLKKDYSEKTKEIQELAHSGEDGTIDLATWMETYKKLKLNRAVFRSEVCICRFADLQRLFISPLLKTSVKRGIEWLEW